MGKLQEKIKKDCPHCNIKSFALEFPLEETGNFLIVCDVHPITKGHILIIPKKHISCIGEYPDDLLLEFQSLYNKFSKFIKTVYGRVSSFEHGVIGQTVFHSHIHLFPFNGSPLDIVPEGENNLTSFNDFAFLKQVFVKDNGYLFFSIGEKKWIVNSKLVASRFFRDRFAKALGNPNRGNWKEMHNNQDLMKKAKKETEDVLKNWQIYK